MITQTAKYALRALIFLAKQEQPGFCQTHEIAHQTKVPANYLGKTLQKLAHARVLDSQKGLHGGFRIARPADQITLYEILIAIEAIPRDFTGDHDSDDGLPSTVFATFAEMTQTYVEALRKTTLAEVAGTGRTAVAMAVAAK